MAFIHRLILISLLFIGANAHAAGLEYFDTAGTWHSTFAAACASKIAQLNLSDNHIRTHSDNGSANGICKSTAVFKEVSGYGTGFAGLFEYILATRPASCGQFEVLSGGVCVCAGAATGSPGACTCAAPNTVTAGVCGAPPNGGGQEQCGSKTGSSSGAFGVDFNGPSPSGNITACSGGCKVSGKSSMCVGYGTPPKTSCYVDSGSFTGAPCTPSPTGSPESTATAAAPTTVPKGKCPGEVNGVTVYVPCSSVSTTSSGTNTSNVTSPDGTTVAGSTTTSTTNTECIGGVCTTVTRTTVGAGTGTSTATGTTTSLTSTEGQDEYCRKNPTAVQCKTASESTFSGDCAAAFSGTGDALSVAIAKATNQVKCLLDPGNGLQPVVDQLAAGTFGQDLEVKAKSVTNFNQTNPLSGSCPGDQPITLNGLGTFMIPLSSMCPYLEALGKIAVLITLIYSTLFVVRGLAS